MFLFRCLASGSSGNAYLLKTERATLLIEAGLPIARLRQALLLEEVRPEDLSAALISHEHRDHCVAAHDLATRHGVPIWANSDVLRAAGLHDIPRSRVLDVGRPMLIGDIEITSFAVSHDAVCPVGFLFRTSGRTAVLATDLGTVNSAVEDAVRQANLIVLESNHDTDMLLRSRYPQHLRRRITGPTGHLSNLQAGQTLAEHVQGDDVEIWLAHLSKENNTPKLAVKTVRRMLASVGLRELPISIALRDRPSLRWNGSPRPRQLSLFTDGGRFLA